MPPKTKITKEEILSASLDFVREKGIEALNARELASRLNCSTQPIFSNFSSMEELKSEVLKCAERLYYSRLTEDLKSEKYPPYKASGMGYIRFAKEEKELFKSLFMRDRSGEDVSELAEDVEPVIAIIQSSLGLSREEALRFHLENWIYVHGIAVMMATSYMSYDMEFVSELVTDMYQGLKSRYTQKTSGEESR